MLLQAGDLVKEFDPVAFFLCAPIMQMLISAHPAGAAPLPWHSLWVLCWFHCPRTTPSLQILCVGRTSCSLSTPALTSLRLMALQMLGKLETPSHLQFYHSSWRHLPKQLLQGCMPVWQYWRIVSCTVYSHSPFYYFCWRSPLAFGCSSLHSEASSICRLSCLLPWNLPPPVILRVALYSGWLQGFSLAYRIGLKTISLVESHGWELLTRGMSDSEIWHRMWSPWYNVQNGCQTQKKMFLC